MCTLFYQCSHCSREYSSSEFFDRLKDHVVPEESGIMSGQGHTSYTSVCKCGEPFRVNKWNIKNVVPHKCSYYLVSTIHLELNQGDDNNPLWYETRIFPCNKFGHILNLAGIDYCRRYTTRMAAEKGHKNAIQSITSITTGILLRRFYYQE